LPKLVSHALKIRRVGKQPPLYWGFPNYFIAAEAAHLQKFFVDLDISGVFRRSDRNRCGQAVENLSENG